MPNADHLKATSSRYTDITHQKIYNSQALEQLLLANEVIFSTIKHHNTAPALNPLIIIIHKIINPFFLYLTKLRRYGMGYQFPRIHTAEILSIMKK
ncbi:MAG: hypothetical protein LBI53_04995 [Candidatus Peribacteria bacterium]|jgi:hypothetical protein|nr:hypothetical protein [Candidatus Peribacteria bacterium]